MDGQNEQGERSTFSKIADIALPIGATVAASYGPTATAAVRTGLGALDKRNEIQRRNALGKDVMRLAEAMGEKDQNARMKSWQNSKPKAAEQTEAEKIIEETGSDAAFATVPMPGEEIAAPEVAADKKMRDREEERLGSFLDNMPEPVRDDVYAQIGAMAMSDPDKALNMLMDRDNFSQTLRLKEMDYYRQELRDRVQMEFNEDEAGKTRDHRAIESMANREFQERLAEMTEAGRNERAAASEEGADRRAALSATTSENVAQIRNDGYLARAKASKDAAAQEDITKQMGIMAKIASDYPSILSPGANWTMEITEGPDRIAFDRAMKALEAATGEKIPAYMYTPDGSQVTGLSQVLKEYQHLIDPDGSYAGE